MKQVNLRSTRRDLSKYSALLGLCSVLTFAANALADTDNGTKIYQTDKYGRIQYHKTHLTVEDNRLIQTSPYGRKLHHKPGLKMMNGKMYQTDSLGRIQYHKPSLIVKD